MITVRVASNNVYDFDITSEWDLRAEPEELSEVVLDPDLFHLWCSSTILKAEVIDHGAPDGMDMTIRLHVKGMLPHTFFCLA